jgi:inosine-uridine nucleoside N-ribohydrolase
VSAPLHVIVDGGLDDALALAVLVGLHHPIEQVIATEGSIDLVTTASVTRRLLTTLGSSVPVRLGVDHGIAGPYPDGRDPFHGPDGFGSRASALLPATTPTGRFQRLDGPVQCTGALTTVALGLRAGQSVSAVTWMGGSVAVGGNMTPAAEFNAWMDPTAADDVLTSGVPVRMVPLDVTRRFVWSTAELDALAAAGRLGAIYSEAIGFAQSRDGRFLPHDAVTAVALVRPDLFAWSSCSVRCETSGGLASGATIIDRDPDTGPGRVMVADDVMVAEVNEEILGAVADLVP